VRNDTYEGLEDFIDSGQGRLKEAVKMRNHNALEDFKSTGSGYMVTDRNED